MAIDFDALNDRLLSQADIILPEWFPNGRWQGNEFCLGSIAGEAGTSLKINKRTGVWTDFADPGHGGSDLTSLYAAHHGLTQGQAARELGGDTMRRIAYAATALLSAPVDLSPPLEPYPAVPLPDNSLFRHREHGVPTALWWYHTRDGDLAFAVARYDYVNGTTRKTYLPWRRIDGLWRQKSAPKPRALYRLPELLRRSGEPILIVEGERACDAAAAKLSGMVVTTWAGGANAYTTADWSEIRDQSVTLWPDNDAPGRECMHGLARVLLDQGCTVRWIDGSELPEGGDAADLAPEALLAWCKGHVGAYDPPVARGAVGVRVTDTTQPRRGTPRHAPDELPDVVAVQSQSVTPPDSTDAESSEVTRETPEPAPQPGRPSLWQPGDTPLNLWQKAGIVGNRALANNNQQPYTNQAVFLALLRVSHLAEKLWYDEFRQRIEWLDPVKERARAWSDADELHFLTWLQTAGGLPKASLSTVTQAIAAHADTHRRNPLLDRLNALVWDKTPRLPTWLAHVYGAPEDQYHADVGRCWLIAMVARAFDPGCKVDSVFCLEGEQGKRKSMSCEVLGFGLALKDGGYASVNVNEFGSVEFLKALEGIWIMEIADLSGFSRADLSRITASITSREDRYRGSYARHVQSRLRTALFVMTTNRPDYITDETGGRRFLPIECTLTDTNIEWLLENRDQLYAEAVHLYKSGTAWWDVEPIAAKQHQDARYAYDVWHDPIEAYLYDREQITVAQVLEAAFGIEPAKHTNLDAQRVTRSLRKLGWRNLVVKEYGKPKRVWKRKADSIQGTEPF